MEEDAGRKKEGEKTTTDYYSPTRVNTRRTCYSIDFSSCIACNVLNSAAAFSLLLLTRHVAASLARSLTTQKGRVSRTFASKRLPAWTYR
jgi:hypothetical protein